MHNRIGLITRTRLAEIISPLIPVFAFVYSTYDPRGYVILFWYVFYFLYSATFSYLSFFFIGLPVMNYLKRKNHYNLISNLVAGAVTGIVALQIILMIFGLMLGSFGSVNTFQNEAFLWGSACGMTVSFTYWLIGDLDISKLKLISRKI